MLTLDELNVAVTEYFNLDNPYSLTDEEFNLIKKEIALNDDLELSLESFRIADDTKRLINQGYVVFDGLMYFENDTKAVEWVNSNIPNLKVEHFSELYDMAQDGKIDDCYYTEWS